MLNSFFSAQFVFLVCPSTSHFTTQRNKLAQKKLQGFQRRHALQHRKFVVMCGFVECSLLLSYPVVHICSKIQPSESMLQIFSAQRYLATVLLIYYYPAAAHILPPYCCSYTTTLLLLIYYHPTTAHTLPPYCCSYTTTLQLLIYPTGHLSTRDVNAMYWWSLT